MRNKIFSGIIWRFAERIGAQGVGFIVSIVLARLLVPEDYGVIALVTVVITILNVFVDSGFGNALIQKKDADSIDFSSVFFLNIAICILLYIILFFAAPYISLFYMKKELTSVIRVLGITLIISGVKNVQQAYVSRNMLFRIFFFSTLGGTLGAAFVGIWMALNGFGVWSLVCQNLFNSIVNTLILWFTVKWRPHRSFSFIRIKELFSYGWKLLFSSLLDTLYNNMRQVLIGKIYTPSDLAFFNRGDQIPSLIIYNINSSIDSVLLPSMSKKQEDLSAIKAMTRRAIKTSSYLLWPIMVGIGVIAEPLVRLLLTEKWILCVPYLRLFCLIYVFWPIHTANLNAIRAVGRSDIFLKLELQKKSIGTIMLLMTLNKGVLIIALSLLLSTIISSIINAFPNSKLLNYNYFEQIRDMLPGILLSFVMACCIYPIAFLGLSDMFRLILQVLFGGIIYILLSIVFKLDSFYYINETIKIYLKNEKKS